MASLIAHGTNEKQGVTHYWPAAWCPLVSYVAYASVTDDDRRHDDRY